MAPMIGCHSVMDRPESVSRVAPPTRTMATMRTAMTPSQMRKPRTCRAGIAEACAPVFMPWAATSLMGRLIAALRPQLNRARPAPLPQHDVLGGRVR
ncbi:hypothetical protein AUC69_02780 [Methyloceanibacter superfactus]|uniref:Uncharacterized protein n=1 Tax=Methyloceanibacter superfactus TaxID=1774969 RepID=A0A1E3VPJ6_9HYPH|nr:hypothetical protein AUC69_02780 [Methyloceanibacter superfactus]